MGGRPRAKMVFRDASSKHHSALYRPMGPTECYNYATLRDRVSRLVGVLRRLGVSQGDRVASLAWNSHRHLELYFAVPALGAVLNTINVRLPAAHVKFILDHSSSKLLFHDATVRELAVDAICRLGGSQLQRIVMGEISGANDDVLDYQAVLASR